MPHHPRSRKLRAAILPLLSIALIGVGCSRVEKVKIVNHFGQPIRIRLNGAETAPLIPAHGEAVLNREFYVGPGVRVTVLTAQGRLLKREEFIDVPGDRQFRPFAVVEVRP